MWIIEVVRWAFYLTLPLTLLIFLVANSLEVESIKYVSERLKREDGSTSFVKLLLFRASVCFLMLTPVFLINDEFFLMVLTGVLLIPSIGFLIPVLADLKYFSQQSQASKVWKWSLLVFSLGLNILTSVLTITSKP